MSKRNKHITFHTYPLTDDNRRSTRPGRTTQNIMCYTYTVMCSSMIEYRKESATKIFRTYTNTYTHTHKWCKSPLLIRDEWNPNVFPDALILCLSTCRSGCYGIR